MTIRSARWIDRAFSARLNEEKAERSRVGISFVETSAGRVRLRHQVAEAERPRLLFAVDGPNAIEHYDALLNSIGDRADVVIFEPPGTGASIPSRGFDFSLSALASCCLDVVSHVGVRTLIFPCYLGFVAQMLAHQTPSQVPKLIAPQFPTWSDMRQWADVVDRKRFIRTPGLGQVLVGVNKRATAQRWYRASTGTVDFARLFSNVSNQVFDFGGCFCLASLMQALDRREPPPPMPAGIGVATVWGDRDRTHRKSTPTPANPGATLVHFESCGHCPELEAPARFADWLFSWLKETKK